MNTRVGGIRTAEVVLPCADLDATAAFFTGRLGFRVEAVFPADGPRIVVVAGHGLRLRLEHGAGGDPGTLLVDRDALDPDGESELVAPNGTRVRLVDTCAPLVLPEAVPSCSVSRAAAAPWQRGRAGMEYRDLLPDRFGGRFVASHIRIPRGGEVPDYVHHHRVHFQLIHCWRGWVRVVYEDQGPPFVLAPGDTVLQPPGIRHRVLECSPGLEVIEVSCPADHETRADHAMALPTPVERPGRSFAGQRFVRSVASEGGFTSAGGGAGVAERDTGIGAATGGIAGARLVRLAGAGRAEFAHGAELAFAFVLAGCAELRGDALAEEASPCNLESGDAVALPPDRPFHWSGGPEGVELFLVTSPATTGFVAEPSTLRS